MRRGPDLSTYFLGFLRLLVPLALLCAAPRAFAEEPLRRLVLQLAWDHQFQFAGYYAAQWQGFYRDAGFEVDIRPALRPDGRMVSSVRSLIDGQADFGVATASFLLGVARGMPLKAVAPIFQTGTGALYYPESMQINGVADLRGKRIGYPAGDNARLLELDTMLAAEGIDPASLEKIGMPPDDLFEALRAGRFDVIWGYGTSFPYLARQAGLQLRALLPSQLGVNFYGDTLLTRSDLAARDPALVVRFRDATLKGWEYALANADSIALRIARELPRVWANDNLEQFNRQQAAIVADAVKYPYVKLGNSNPERWRLMVQQLAKAQIIQDQPAVETFLFDPERDERLRNDRIELYLAVGIGVIGLVFLGSVGGGIMLRRAVRRRTAELTDARSDLEQLTATLEARVRERSRAVQESETRLREITDALPSLVWTAGPNGELTWVNQRWCQFTGLGYEQSIRHGWLRALHAQDHDRRERAWSLAQESGIFDLECRFRRADGAWIWFLVRAMPRRDQDGRVREWIGSSTDIHHRKQAERDRALLSDIYPALMEEASSEDLALSLAEALGRHLNTARVVFLEFDVKRDLCTVFARYMRERGLLPTQFRLGSFGQPLVDELRAGHTVVIDDVGADYRTADSVRTFQTIRAHAILFKPLLRHGNLVAAVSVIDDQPRRWLPSEVALLDEVAERSFLAMERVKAAKALKNAKVAADLANLSKSRFLAAASHDLRQPFQAMRLFHHVLSARLRDNEDIHAAAKLGEAMASGEELLNSLLDISTLDAGTMRMSIDNVAVDDMLEELRSSFAPVAAQKGLTLKVVPSSCRVRTDPVLFKRMVRNLVSNAIRYTNRGGILLGCRNRGAFLHVQIWDSGIGIPDDQLDAVFDDFYQIHNAERDRTKGLGLGLSIVRRTAHLLGHDIQVRSSHGRGSVFTLIVPKAKDVAAAMLPTDETTRQSGPRHRILLVEDDAAQLAGMRTLLESWGHTVVIAAPTPEVAMLDLRTSAVEPSLIITDFRLPGPLNGEQFIERVQDEMGRPIPAVIVTGDTAERLRSAEGAGCRVVYKPFRPAELAQVIEALPLRRPLSMLLRA